MISSNIDNIFGMFCEVIVHHDFVQSPEDNHACPNFLAMNKIAAIKWVSLT